MNFHMGAMDLQLELDGEARDNLLRILAIYRVAVGAGLSHEEATTLFAECLARSNCHQLYLAALRASYPDVCKVIAAGGADSAPAPGSEAPAAAAAADSRPLPFPEGPYK